MVAPLRAGSRQWDTPVGTLVGPVHRPKVTRPGVVRTTIPGITADNGRAQSERTTSKVEFDRTQQRHAVSRVTASLGRS